MSNLTLSESDARDVKMLLVCAGCTPAHAQNLTDLIALFDRLGPDEIRTIKVLAERLLEGQRRYGQIDIASEPRDFVKERSEEIQDLLIYTAFQTVRDSLTKP